MFPAQIKNENESLTHDPDPGYIPCYAASHTSVITFI